MITAGYLALHSQGRRGGSDVALLDVCQDYALKFLHDHDIFDFGVVLKGGTALRKFRAGSAGRFSTDLDFATPDVETADLLIDNGCATISGRSLFAETYTLPQWNAAGGLPVPGAIRSMTPAGGRLIILTDYSIEVWSRGPAPKPAKRRAITP